MLTRNAASASRMVVVSVLSALVSACAHGGNASSGAKSASTADDAPTLSTCGTAIDWLADPSLAGEDDAKSQVPSAAVLAAYSSRALRVAEAVGIVDELNELQVARGTPAEMVARRQEILERLELAKADISAAAVTADCEQGRADLLRDSLKDHETSRTRALTIASLGVGALTSVVAGAWVLADRDANRGPAAAGIAGGALGAVLGGLALTTSGSRVYLAHPRNQLRDLWTNPPRSALFAPSVWHFLAHEPAAASAKAELHATPVRPATPRQQMTQRWTSNGMLGRDDASRAHRVALFFGEGGAYDLDELRARADMLDEVQAEVDLMNQELELLLRQFTRSRPAERVREEHTGE